MYVEWVIGAQLFLKLRRASAFLPQRFVKSIGAVDDAGKYEQQVGQAFEILQQEGR